MSIDVYVHNEQVLFVLEGWRKLWVGTECKHDALHDDGLADMVILATDNVQTVREVALNVALGLVTYVEFLDPDHFCSPSLIVAMR